MWTALAHRGQAGFVELRLLDVGGVGDVLRQGVAQAARPAVQAQAGARPPGAVGGGAAGGRGLIHVR